MRYLRTFCHRCGALHSSMKDLSSVLTHFRKKLPALFEEKQSKKDKLCRIETYSELGMRGINILSTYQDILFRSNVSYFHYFPLPIAIMRYITMAGNKSMFREDGYKMVFLFMYLAMNCTGKHRLFAAKHFREVIELSFVVFLSLFAHIHSYFLFYIVQMCGRFSEQLDKVTDIDNEDFNHLTTVTSALVLTQLTNQRSQAFYMFCDGADEPNKEHGSSGSNDKKPNNGAYHSTLPKTGGWPKGVSRSQMTAAKSQNTIHAKRTAASAATVKSSSIASTHKRKRASSASEPEEDAGRSEERSEESDSESETESSRPRHRLIPILPVKRAKSSAVTSNSNGGNNSDSSNNIKSGFEGAVDLTQDSPPIVAPSTAQHTVKTEVTTFQQTTSNHRASTVSITATSVPSTTSLRHQMDVIDLCSSSESDSEPEQNNKPIVKPSTAVTLPKTQSKQQANQSKSFIKVESSPSNSTTSSSNHTSASSKSNISSGSRTRAAVRTAVQELGYLEVSDEDDEELFNAMVASWAENEAYKEKMKNNSSSSSCDSNISSNSNNNISSKVNNSNNNTSSSSSSSNSNDCKHKTPSSITNDFAAEVLRPKVSVTSVATTAAATTTVTSAVSTAAVAAAIARDSVSVESEDEDAMSEDDKESPANSAANSSPNSSKNYGSTNTSAASSPTTTQRVTRLTANTAYNSAVATATQQSLFDGHDHNDASNSNGSTQDIIKSYAVLKDKLIRAITYNCNSHGPMECTRKFDFSSKKAAIPLTPAEHCGYCGHNDKIDRDDVGGNSSNSSSKGKKIKYERETVRNTGKYKKNNSNSSSSSNRLVCVKCDNKVVPHICHDTITDSLFASYSFQAIGLNLDLTNLDNKYVSKVSDMFALEHLRVLCLCVV